MRKHGKRQNSKSVRTKLAERWAEKNWTPFAPQDGGHVSNWIAERRENNRAEEISAIRRMFGSESFLSKTAWAWEFSR